MQSKPQTDQERIAQTLDPLVATLPEQVSSTVRDIGANAILAAELQDKSVPKAERMALAREMIGE